MRGAPLVQSGDLSAYGFVDVSITLSVVGRQNNNGSSEHGKVKRASIVEGIEGCQMAGRSIGKVWLLALMLRCFD